MIDTSKTTSFNKAESWKIFDSIYRRYDFLNALLSLGWDRIWRNKLLNFVPQDKELTVLDLATGTGDVLLTLVRNRPDIIKAVGIDLSENMLGIGRQKIGQLGLSEKIQLQYGDAMKLSFNDRSFNLATMSFGIRNTENPIFVLKEIYRVLAGGGRCLILEFSLPRNFLIKCLYLIYLKFFVPGIGGIISGNFKAYYYLNRTIERFPYGKTFLRMMRQCGFAKVEACPLLFGIATIYTGERAP